MSLQWTFVATFLYVEIFILLLLLLPFITPGRWQKCFKSRIFRSVSSYGNVYFTVLILILFVFFLDAIREIHKYSNNTIENPKFDPMVEIQLHMKLFRAQRNFYIAGFALLIWFVLRRLIVLISNQAGLIASNEAALKQAKSASETAQKLINEKDEASATESVQGKSELETEINKRKEAEKEIELLNEKLDETKAELQRQHVNCDTLKKQAGSVSQEYDRLMTEYTKLEQKLQVQSGTVSSKKEE